jgi:hypothetical protein
MDPGLADKVIHNSGQAPARNGNGHNGHNGHRRPRPQVHHGFRRAARKADTVLLLTAGGMSVTEAAERCSVGLDTVYAMKAIKESENTALYDRVMRGGQSVLASGKKVANATAAITALKKCSALERELVRLATGATADPVTMLLNLTPDQVAAVSRELSPDWFWDRFIAPVMSNTEPTTKPAAVANSKTAE